MSANGIVNLSIPLETVRMLRRLVAAQRYLGVGMVFGVDLPSAEHLLQEAEHGLGTGEYSSGTGDFSFSFHHFSNKVAAIKALRQATGLGLYESKQIVDTAKMVSPGHHQLIFKNSDKGLFERLVDACSENTLKDSSWPKPSGPSIAVSLRTEFDASETDFVSQS